MSKKVEMRDGMEAANAPQMVRWGVEVRRLEAVSASFARVP